MLVFLVVQSLASLEQTRGFGSVCVCLHLFSPESNRNLPTAHPARSPAGFIAPDSWLGFLQEKCQFVKC